MKIFTSCMGGRGSREEKAVRGSREAQRRTTVHRFSRVHQGAVNCLAEGTPVPCTIVTGGADGNATLFNYSTGKVLQYLRHEGGKPVTAVASSPCGRIVTGSRDAVVRLWSGPTATPFTGHTLVVTAVVLTRDRIISGSRDNCINAWDITAGKLLYSISESRNLITGLRLTGHLLVQTSEDKRLRLWDTRNLELVHVYPVRQYIQSCCDVNSAGTIIATGSNGFNGGGCEVSLWDIRGRALLREMHGHEQSVNTVRFFPTANEMVVSGATDSMVKVWDGGVEILEKRLPGLGAITDVLAYADKTIICSTNNGCVKLTVDDQDFVVDMLCF